MYADIYPMLFINIHMYIHLSIYVSIYQAALAAEAVLGPGPGGGHDVHGSEEDQTSGTENLSQLRP